MTEVKNRLGSKTWGLLAIAALMLGATVVACDGGGAPLFSQPCPDADSDGVCDDDDDCPGTEAGCDVGADGCTTDSDGDGVCDGNDLCPGTPDGCTVDADGCPTADADGDGVCDGNDLCPGTEAGCDVDADGCTTDSDGDGVCDGNDLCPGTPDGCTVDADGCDVNCDNCSRAFTDNQMDSTVCYSTGTISSAANTCGTGTLTIHVLVDQTTGDTTVETLICQNPQCNGMGGPEEVMGDVCNPDCQDDATEAECQTTAVSETNSERDLRLVLDDPTCGAEEILVEYELSCGDKIQRCASIVDDGECVQ